MLFTVSHGCLIFCGSADNRNRNRPLVEPICLRCRTKLPEPIRLAGQPSNSLDDTEEAKDSDSEVEILIDDDEILCMSCSGSILPGSRAAKCSCTAYMCEYCLLMDPTITGKQLPALKQYLQSINGGSLSKCYGKGAIIRKIDELQRQHQLKQLAESCPGCDMSENGDPPSFGALVFEIGSRSFFRDPAPKRDSPALITEVIGHGADYYLPKGESVVLGDDGTYEIELELHSPRLLGMFLDNEEPTDQTGNNGIKVVSVEQSSEAMRLGVREKDILLTVNGEEVSRPMVFALTRTRPLWLKFSRPEPPAHVVPVTYEAPIFGSILMVYQQPNKPGDTGQKYSLAELRRLGDAAYLQKMENAKRVTVADPLQQTLNYTFNSKDIDEKIQQSQWRTKVDPYAANRIRPVEPTQPASWNSTGIPLLLSFFRVSNETNDLHSNAIRRYIDTKYMPKVRKTQLKRKVVDQYIHENREQLRLHHERVVKGMTHASEETEQAVLSALVDVKLKEAEQHQQNFINSCQDEAWRQSTTEVTCLALSYAIE